MESEEIRIDELISYLEEAKKKIDEIELQLFRLKAERIGRKRQERRRQGRYLSSRMRP